jgi:hypothetical protein
MFDVTSLSSDFQSECPKGAPGLPEPLGLLGSLGLLGAPWCLVPLERLLGGRAGAAERIGRGEVFES